MHSLLNRELTSDLKIDYVSRSVPASCGELVQGYINGEAFLINSPINLYSKATYRTGGRGLRSLVTERRFPKAYEAAKSLANHGNLHEPANISIDSKIPRGKGMASSTAEIASSISLLFSKKDSSHLQILHKKVLEVDGSTDATYLPGITMLNHLSGEVMGSYQAPSSLGILIVDQGGSFETNLFDRNFAKSYATKRQDEYLEAASTVCRGLSRSCVKTVALGATKSSYLQQGIISNELFSKLEGLLYVNGVLGINSAHTGTVLGVMFDRGKHDGRELLNLLANKVGRDKILGCYSLVSGGIF